MSAHCGGLDINIVLKRHLQVNYINPLLYPVSVRGCPSPVRGILCILIGDLTPKSALLLFTLLSASKPYFKKRPIIGNNIECL